MVTDPTGRVLGGLVSPDEFATYQAWKEKLAPKPETNSIEAIMARERQAFERLLPELLLEHQGEWVAIANEQPVRYGTDFQSVIVPVREKYGKRPVYVREILDNPRVYKMLSPHIVR